MVSSSKQEARTSCKIYCGQPLVDRIGSVSSGVMSTVGLELKSFINFDLTWKAVSKRKRSGTRGTRKRVAESMTPGLEIANKNDKKLENLTVSESEKLFGLDVLEQHFSKKLENIPIKKRRFMFRSPSPPPPMIPFPLLETSGKHLDFQITPDHSSGSSSKQWKQLMKSDCSAMSHARSIIDEKISEVINGVEDFSGIEILAAVACSDSMCNDVTEYEGTPVAEESTQERIQSSDSSIHLEDSTASLETACCFSKGSVTESKFEGSSFQDNSFVVLHEVPSDNDTIPERSIPLCEFPSSKGTDLLVNESKSEVSSFPDNSFAVLHEIPSDKNKLPERFITLPDDRLLWDLNVPMDAWPCDGGIVDSQNDSIAKISMRSEELQTAESHDIKTDTINDGVSYDDGSNRMTSDLRSIPTGTDDLGTDTEKQESSYGSQDIDDSTIDVVSYEVDGIVRMTSDFRSMPVETDNLSAEEQESSYDSQYIKIYTTKEEISSDDVGVDNSLTSDSRVMLVGTDDLSSEKQEYEVCSGYDTRLPTKEPQDMKNDTTNEVVSSDVDGGNGMTSDMRTIPLAHDECSTEKQEAEGCSGYDSQFEDGELRESDVQCWEEIEQVDYDTEFEEESPFDLEPESCDQEVKVDSGSNPELAESFKCCETGKALRKSTVSLKIRNVEVSNGETMEFDCLDRSDYDLRVDLSEESKNELLSCVEGSLSFDVLKSRPAKFNGSYPRVERGAGSDRFMGSGRSSPMHRRRPDGACIFNPSSNCLDSSKCEHMYIPNGPYNLGRPRSNIAFGNREYLVGTDQSSSDVVGVSRPDHRTTRQFMGSYRPLLRRSPIGREDSYNMHLRMPTVRDTSVTSTDQNRFRRFLQRVGRGIRDEYLRHVPDESTQYMGRMLHHLDRRERSTSSHGGRPHHAIPHKSARSRSRSRSPMVDPRCGNRSLDFVSDAKMEGVKLPFTKRSAAGYGEFVSPPRNHASPQRNSRMFLDRNPYLDHSRGQKSHVRMIRQDQRFDQPRPIRRFNSDDCFNPMIRPRRFPDRDAGVRGFTYEVNDDGNHDTRYAMNHRVRYYNTDGGARRFRYTEEDSFMAKNSLL